MGNKLVALIDKVISDSNTIRQELSISESSNILKAGMEISNCLNLGGKIMLCGNGGSAADSQHLATELVVKFNTERQPLSGIALTTDTSILTAIANDFGFDKIFSRQIEAIGEEGDVLLCFSTSGTSKNILEAVQVAKNLGIYTIGLTGNITDKNLLAKKVDLPIKVASDNTARIQEVHIMVGHILIQLIERMVKTS